MFRIPTVAITICSAFLSLTATSTRAKAPTARPNVVLIVADDLGYGDLGCFGCPDIPTPHIDSIAKAGVRFTQAYAYPTCSPTRAGLLTGRWPIRYGIMRTVIPPWSRYGLPLTERLLPEALAEPRTMPSTWRWRSMSSSWRSLAGSSLELQSSSP